MRSVEHGSLVSADPADHTPRVLDGRVWTIAEWGDLVIVGGDFTSVRDVTTDITYDRMNIFAFDKYTGIVDERFAPEVNGQVRAVAIDPDGRGVFAAGRFSTVNGEYRKSLAFLDRDGRRVADWRGAIKSGAVFDLKVADRLLYAAGNFTRVNASDIGHLAAIDIDTGEVSTEMSLPFADPRRNTTLHLRRIDVSPDGRTLGALGTFQRVDGQTRDQIALIDISASPDRLSTWATDYFEDSCSSRFPSQVRDISFSPDSSFFAIAATGGLSSYPHACDQAVRFETDAAGAGQTPTWVDYTGGDSLLSIEVTDHAVYAGGHNRWFNNPFENDDAGPGAVESGSITALDPVNGLPLDWNPVRQPRGQGVLEIEATDTGLWIGHDTDFVADEYRPRLTLFPVVGGADVPPTSANTLPTQLGVVSNGTILLRDFDGSTVGSPIRVANADSRFQNITGATLVSGKLLLTDGDGLEVVFWHDGPLPGSTTVDRRGVDISSSAIDGLAYDHELRRLYFTTGDNILRYRYVTTQDVIIGAEMFTVPSPEVDLRNVRGMTIIDDRLYFGSTDGNLRSVAWVDGRPVGPATLVSGPGVDGNDWDRRGLFATSPDTALLPTPADLAERETCGSDSIRRTSSITFPVTAGERILGHLDVQGDSTTNLFLYDPTGRTVRPDSLVGGNSKRLRHVADESGTWRLTSNFTSGGGCLSMTASTESVVNRAPRIDRIGDRTIDTVRRVVIPIRIDDPEGDTVTVEASGLPPGLVVANTLDAIVGTATELGVFTVMLTASDGLDIGTTTFTLTVTNTPPSISPVDDLTIGVFEEQSLPITVTDEDVAALSLSVSGLPSGLTYDRRAAAIVGQATELGVFPITITAADLFATTTERFVVTVEDRRPDPLEVGAIIEIRNIATGGLLSADGFTAITSSATGDTSRWKVEAGGTGGTYYLRNVASEFYLDGDADQVDMFPFSGPDRLWTVTRLGLDRFHIRNVLYDRLLEGRAIGRPVRWDNAPAERNDEWSLTRVGP